MHPTTVTGRSRYVVAVLIALVGLVWALQGAGVLPGSFMSGDRFWLLAGVALIAAAAAYAAWPRLRGGRR
jgi:hypothetical protein